MNFKNELFFTRLTWLLVLFYHFLLAPSPLNSWNAYSPLWFYRQQGVFNKDSFFSEIRETFLISPLLLLVPSDLVAWLIWRFMGFDHLTGEVQWDGGAPSGAADIPGDNIDSADEAEGVGTSATCLAARHTCLGWSEHQELKSVRQGARPRMAAEMAAASPTSAGSEAAHWEAAHTVCLFSWGP